MIISKSYNIRKKPYKAKTKPKRQKISQQAGWELQQQFRHLASIKHEGCLI